MVHPADIPDEIMAGFSPEDRQRFAILGMNVPYDKITPEDAEWLSTKIAEQQARKLERGGVGVQSDPRALKKLMSQ
jgi:hypothetical protein